MFKLLAGADFLPTSVQLRHHPLTDLPAYTSYFECPVEFEASSYGFRFAASILVRPVGVDSAVHAVVQDYLDTIVIPTESTTADAVAALIRRMLPTGGLDLDLVADHLAHHRRTLQRQLAAQGTTFGALVDQVCDLAQEFAALIDAHPGFELYDRPTISTVLFRPARAGDDTVAAIRRTLLHDGRAVLGRAALDGASGAAVSTE